MKYLVLATGNINNEIDYDIFSEEEYEAIKDNFRNKSVVTFKITGDIFVNDTWRKLT